MKTNRVGFIGAGNMAGSIISSILDNKILAPKELAICDISVAKIDQYRAIGVSVYENIGDLVLNSDIVFLSIKPQTLSEVLTEIKGIVENNTLFVSIVAGASTESIRRLLRKDVPIIRVMPNTPILISEGATAISRTTNVDDKSYKVINNIFSHCGKLEEVPEEQMNDIVSINGSSPAYIYIFAKAFLEFASQKHIDDEVAKNLLVQSLIGSAKMIEKTDKSLDQLITEVSSPGGTTIAGSKVLLEENFSETIKKALTACADRASELSQ